MDIKKIGDEIVQVVREYVGQQLAGISKQLVELTGRLDRLPVPKDGKDADPLQVKALVDEAVAQIPAPKDGASVTVEDVAPLIDARVKAAVAEIPVPANGKDADPIVIAELVRAEVAKLPAPVDGKSVTIEEVTPLIASEVAKAVGAIPAPKDGKDAPAIDQAALAQEVLAQIPKPQDGKSITVEDVAPLIEQQVKAAAESLPKPADGKDADPALVAELVREEVSKIPVPADGKSVTVDDVAPLIASEVEKAVGALPVPKDGRDGKDAEPVDREAIAAEVLAQVRVPEDGKSVSIADVEPMLAQLVEKAVGALPKAKDGESVPVEQVQRMIDEAVAKAVAAIPVPKDGEHGRDALDIEILPAINEARRYARGTYASHNGGLWRAMRSTEGMDGWECIVEGDAADEIELGADLRTFTLRKVKSSGRVIEKSFALPVVLHRGIYKADEEYQAGDATTWDGSTWIAQRDTKEKPGTSDAWRLSVKRGRDGRDGNRGEPGKRGAQGRDGKDLTQMAPDGSKW